MATWKKIARRGKDVTIGEISDHTFESTDRLAIDGDPMKDVTFQNLAATSFSNQTKNTTSFSNSDNRNSATYTNQSKN